MWPLEGWGDLGKEGSQPERLARGGPGQVSRGLPEHLPQGCRLSVPGGPDQRFCLCPPHACGTARLLPPSIALGLRANLLGRTQPSPTAFSPHPSPPDPGNRPASLSPTEFLPSRPPESPQCLWWEAGLWSTLGVCGRWGQSCLWEGRGGREKDRPGPAVCGHRGSRLTARPGCSSSQAPGCGAPLSTLSPDTKRLPPVPKP